MYYSVFHSEDIEKILKSMESLKSSFKKFPYTETLGESDGVVVLRYKNLVIVASEELMVVDAEVIERFEVKFEEIGDQGKKFKYGCYSAEDVLRIEGDVDESFLYGVLPALLSEIAIARVLARDAFLRAEHLSKEETKIIKETMKILEKAKLKNVGLLEELAMNVSHLKAPLFTAYMSFKDEVEEISSSLIRAKMISKEMGDFLQEWISTIEFEVENLRHFESSFNQTLMAVNDALQVVHLTLEMFQRKEYLELEKRTSNLQAAAAVIEFVAVFYYTLKIWQVFLPIENLPSSLAFSLLAAFTALVVYLTDAIGEFLSRKKLGKKLPILLVSLAVIVTLMAFLPLIF